jgi:hypothetical protein
VGFGVAGELVAVPATVAEAGRELVGVVEAKAVVTAALRARTPPVTERPSSTRLFTKAPGAVRKSALTVPAQPRYHLAANLNDP